MTMRIPCTEGPPGLPPEAPRGAEEPAEPFQAVLDLHQARTATAEGQPQTASEEPPATPAAEQQADGAVLAPTAPLEASPAAVLLAPPIVLQAAVAVVPPPPDAPPPDASVAPEVRPDAPAQPSAPTAVAPLVALVAPLAAQPAASPQPAAEQVSEPVAAAQPVATPPVASPHPAGEQPPLTTPADVAAAQKLPTLAAAPEQQPAPEATPEPAPEVGPEVSPGAGPRSGQGRDAPSDRTPAPPASQQAAAQPQAAAAPGAPQANGIGPAAPSATPAAAERLGGPPSPPVPTGAARLEQVIEAVEFTVRASAARNVTHARLALRPAELGHVEVRLRSSDEGLSARVIADAPQAASVLAAAVADLRRSLEQQGIVICSLEIGVAGEDRAAAGYAHDETERRGDAAPRGTGSAPEAFETTTETTIELPNGVLVDVLA